VVTPFLLSEFPFWSPPRGFHPREADLFCVSRFRRSRIFSLFFLFPLVDADPLCVYPSASLSPFCFARSTFDIFPGTIFPVFFFLRDSLSSNSGSATFCFPIRALQSECAQDPWLIEAWGRQSPEPPPSAFPPLDFSFHLGVWKSPLSERGDLPTETTDLVVPVHRPPDHFISSFPSEFNSPMSLFLSFDFFRWAETVRAASFLFLLRIFRASHPSSLPSTLSLDFGDSGLQRDRPCRV